MRRALYSLLLYLLCPLVLLWLLWRSLRAPAYRRRWRERFGRVPGFAERPVWVHAASVGEVQAGLALIRALRQRYPERPLLVTTTTPTGGERARAALGEAIVHCYAPLDLPHAVVRFLRRARPAVAIVLETELWPNLFHRLRGEGIPLLLVNARLSPRSVRSYRWLGTLLRSTLECVDVVAAQSRADAERYAAAGAPRSRLQVTGNLKFDLQLPAGLPEQGRQLRAQLGTGRSVWIAASTHEGEDTIALEAHRRLREREPEALLILVPRHPERFDSVAGLCLEHGFPPARRSQGESAAAAAVYLGDTMGELMTLYAAADVAFVGGSLVPVGGHNPLEPAALGLPVLSGPQVFNFREVMDLMEEAGALEIVADGEVLAQKLERLLADPERRRQMGEGGQRVVAANRGALERVLELVSAQL